MCSGKKEKKRYCVLINFSANVSDTEIERVCIFGAVSSVGLTKKAWYVAAFAVWIDSGGRLRWMPD